jgi:hypothetical protein
MATLTTSDIFRQRMSLMLISKGDNVMNAFLNKAKVVVCLAGALALTFPAVASARSASSERWHQGQADLQKNLPPGQPADVYRKKMEDLGYKVTATDDKKANFEEYELVKGDQTWKVKINVDDSTHKATKVNVTSNMWKSDATKQELERPKSTAGSTPSSSTMRNTAANRNDQYSARDRATSDQLINELKSLPVERDKQFYKEALRQRGYDIARVDKDEKDELELEAVKNGHSVKMDVAFNSDTGKSTKVDASSLWAESESTSRTREAQQGDTAQAVPHHK